MDDLQAIFHSAGEPSLSRPAGENERGGGEKERGGGGKRSDRQRNLTNDSA